MSAFLASRRHSGATAQFALGYREGQECIAKGHQVPYLRHMASYPGFTEAFRRGFNSAIDSLEASRRTKFPALSPEEHQLLNMGMDKDAYRAYKERTNIEVDDAVFVLIYEASKLKEKRS